MEKYILKDFEKEVKIGDRIHALFEVNNSVVCDKIIYVDSEFLKESVESGFVNVVDESALSLDEIIEHLSDRTGCSVDTLNEGLGNLASISPASVFNILLKEISIMFDKKYDEPISKAKNIYVINNLTGKINHISNPDIIRNFDSCTAFRSYEDAKEATFILKKQMDILYGGK